MEYLGKGSLADQVGRDGALEWADVARVGVRLAGALETAHRASVLHRDIKPDNILLSDYREPKLADFGIPAWSPPSWRAPVVAEMEAHGWAPCRRWLALHSFTRPVVLD